MKKKNSSSYHHGNLKDALIEEALAMVISDGVESITLRELTTKLGTSRSAIYRHFSSKDELIKAVIQAGFNLLDETISPMLTSNESILNRFHNMGEAYIAFALANPNIYRMIFGNEVQTQREESCDIHDKEQSGGFQHLVALLIEAQEKQIFKHDDPVLQATYVWASIHGLSNLCIDGHIHVQDNIEALFELSFETIIKGMRF